MAQQRSLPEKVRDIKSTYEQFAEMLTPPEKREVFRNMVGAQAAAAAESGDPAAFAALVQASLNLDKVISANDRAALLAAVMANSNVARDINLAGIEGEDA